MWIMLLILSIGPDVELECDLVQIDGSTIACYNLKSPEVDSWAVVKLSTSTETTVTTSEKGIEISWLTPAGVRVVAKTGVLIRYL